MGIKDSAKNQIFHCFVGILERPSAMLVVQVSQCAKQMAV